MSHSCIVLRSIDCKYIYCKKKNYTKLILKKFYIWKYTRKIKLIFAISTSQLAGSSVWTHSVCVKCIRSFIGEVDELIGHRYKAVVRHTISPRRAVSRRHFVKSAVFSIFVIVNIIVRINALFNFTKTILR